MAQLIECLTWHAGSLDVQSWTSQRTGHCGTCLESPALEAEAGEVKMQDHSWAQSLRPV